MRYAIVAIAAGAAFGAIGVANAATISNADFEQPAGVSRLGTFPGWTETTSSPTADPAQLHPGIAGTQAAKLTLATAGGLRQSVSSPASQWTVALDLAVTDPGGSATTSGRSIQLNLLWGASAGQNINLIIGDLGNTGLGDVRLASNGTFQDPTNLRDFITFSTDTNADGQLTGSELQVNHLVVTGDFSTATPTYTVSATSATGVNRSVTGLSFWQGATAPAPGSTLNAIDFQMGNITAGAFAIVDNVIVPEPSTMALLSPALCLGLVRVRRRDRIG